MAIDTPRVSTDIAMPTTRGSTAKDRMLRALLLGYQIAGEQENRQSAIQGQKDLVAQKDVLDRAQKAQDLASAQDALKQAGGKVSVRVGEASLTPRDDSMRAAALMERQDRHKQIRAQEDAQNVQRIEDRVMKAGLPQSVEALKRIEDAVPGITAGEARLKSLGGLKNLIPNMAVPVLENMRVLPKGSASERAAMQELANTKIYDSSGKQINEAEMRRIQDAQGLRGVFQPEVINESAKQVANQVFQKQNQITAGAEPEALQTFKQRGGMAGYGTIEDLLGVKRMPAEVAKDAEAREFVERYIRNKKAESRGF